MKKLVTIIYCLIILLLSVNIASASVAGQSYGTTLSAIPAPPSVAVNHVELMTLNLTGSLWAGATPPSGWQYAGKPTYCYSGTTSIEQFNFYRVETSADTPSTTYDVDTTATGNASITDFANLDYTNPIVAIGTPSCGTGVAPSVSPGSLSNQEYIVTAGSTLGMTPPTGLFIPIYNDYNTSGHLVMQGISVTPGTGSTGTNTFTNAIIANTIILREAGAGGVLIRGVTFTNGGTSATVPPQAQSTDALVELGAGTAACTDTNGTWTVVDSVAAGFGANVQTFSGTVAASHTFTCSGGGMIFALANANATADAHSHNSCTSCNTISTTPMTTVANNDSLFDVWVNSINNGSVKALEGFYGNSNGNASIWTADYGFQGTAGLTTAVTPTQASAASGSYAVASLAIKPATQPTTISPTPTPTPVPSPTATPGLAIEGVKLGNASPANIWTMYSDAPSPAPAQALATGDLGPAPSKHDLLALIFEASPSATITFNPACTGYWTSQSSPSTNLRVYTADALGGGLDPEWCSISPSTGSITNISVVVVHSTDGLLPILDSSCAADQAAATTVSSCTLATAVAGEAIYDYALVDSGAYNVNYLGNQAVPLTYSGGCPGHCAAAWQGQELAGTSLAETYNMGGSTSTALTYQFAFAANGGGGVKRPAYVVINAQPSANYSVYGAGTLPYTSSSPNTPTFPPGVQVGDVVPAKVLCGGGTCGTIAPPTGWTRTGGVVGPLGGSEVDDYCHTYTGTEGTQNWSFSGFTAGSLFVQYVPTNIHNGTCTTSTSTSDGTVSAAYSAPAAARDGLLVNGLASNNQGQLWMGINPDILDSQSGYYGTLWGTCQYAGSCDHENYHTEMLAVPGSGASPSKAFTYYPPKASWAATAPTSISMSQTLVEPSVSTGPKGWVEIIQ